jgi:predicted NodU family carbamoyl transferase
VTDAEETNEAAPAAGLDVQLAAELIERAKAQGVSLVGPDGLLAGITKTVLQAALDAEMTEHLGYEEGERPAQPGGNHRGVAQPRAAELHSRADDPLPERPDRRRYPQLDPGIGMHVQQTVKDHPLDRLHHFVGDPVAALVFEGGLALNCVSNTRLLEGSRFEEVDVSFGASEPGVAIGAAFFASQEASRPPRVSGSPYLGPAYGDEEILGTLREYACRVE